MSKSTCVLTLTFLALVSVVFAQERNEAWGTGRAPCMAGKTVKAAPAYLGKIEPAKAVIPGGGPSSPQALVFPNSVVAGGGAGLRLKTRAHISISGLQGFSAFAAVMYWSIITEGPAPAKFYTVKLKNEQTNKIVSLTGTVVGTGPSPCWNGDTITVFRVLVPTGASGPLGDLTAGNYEVDVPPGDEIAQPLNGDPWIGTQSPPSWEGVSLFLVGGPTTGLLSGTTAFYDTGIAGTTFGGPFGDTTSSTLVLPSGSQTIGPTAFYNVGADGQVGTSIDAVFPGVVTEQTFIDVTQVAGFTRTPGTAPSTLDTDSDWNGTVAGPLPMLWDTTAHSISPGVTTTLDVTFTNAKEDCLTQVANVVFIQ
jgi:hypothetical protein